MTREVKTHGWDGVGENAEKVGGRSQKDLRDLGQVTELVHAQFPQIERGGVTSRRGQL